MRFHIHHHLFEEELLMANASLAEQLSAVVSVLSIKDETIASLSAALDGAGSDSSAVSSAVSAAVDAEDNEIAAEISTILG